MPVRKKRDEEEEADDVFTKAARVYHVCVVNHLADSSNYKYDYRRYRIVVARRTPEARQATVNFYAIKASCGLEVAIRSRTDEERRRKKSIRWRKKGRQMNSMLHGIGYSFTENQLQTRPSLN